MNIPYIYRNDPRCSGYQRRMHRAAFVYVISGRVYCAGCYLSYLADGQEVQAA